MGQSRVSGRYKGKTAIQNKLVPTLSANFATDYRNYAEEIIAHRDRVVVLARGEVKTVRARTTITSIASSSACATVRSSRFANIATPLWQRRD